MTGIDAPTTSASWKASVPIREAPTWPEITTMGTESMCASARAVRVLVAPGPDVTRAHPTRPVARAYPSAACPAPCSWRTRTWLSFELMSGS